MQQGLIGHCGQLQFLYGLREEPSQHKSLVHIIVGSQLQVSLLNANPLMQFVIDLHCGHLQSLQGCLVEPSQHLSDGQVLIASHLHVVGLN